jgi:hypothetical protein
MVSAYTNFYDTGVGYGEIPSDGTAQGSGSFVYANFSDGGSGVATVTADLATGGILTGGSAVALASSTFTTYANAATWGWRSSATVINTGLADGTRTYTVTGTDKVGNATTSGAKTVEIDDTPFSTATGASCVNAGNADDLLASGDTTDFILGDTIYPGSIKAGWTGTTLTGSPILRNNATADFFNLNGDFGVTLLSGTATGTAWNLGASNWVTSSTTFTNSTLTLRNATTLRLAYQGASVADRGATAQAKYGTTVRDAAGNTPAAAITVSCTTTPW